jgi:hypothetical protein
VHSEHLQGVGRAHRQDVLHPVDDVDLSVQPGWTQQLLQVRATGEPLRHDMQVPLHPDPAEEVGGVVADDEVEVDVRSGGEREAQFDGVANDSTACTRTGDVTCHQQVAELLHRSLNDRRGSFVRCTFGRGLLPPSGSSPSRSSRCTAVTFISLSTGSQNRYSPRSKHLHERMRVRSRRRRGV